MNIEKFEKYLHSETRSVVINGSFSPSLFQPTWFAAKGLIGKEEAESADIKVIIPDFCQITIGGFELFCNRNKLQILTRKSPYFIPLVDLVCQIFKLCPETPIRNVGLNCTFTFDMQNSDSYYNIGQEMVMLTRWNGILPNARLQNISMEGAKDENDCQSNMQVSPTSDTRLSYGVDIAINNHFVFTNGYGDSVVTLVSKHFEEYMKKSKIMACSTIDEYVK